MSNFKFQIPNVCMSILIGIYLVLVVRFPAAAQTEDPKSIKLKSFSPPPTHTPAATLTLVPTKTPPAVGTITGTVPTGSTNLPTGGQTPTPTEATGGSGNPEDCAKIGLSMFVPQPRFLERTTLCDKGTIWPPYTSSFIPRDMVNLTKALGGKYWVRRNDIIFKSGLVSNLSDLLGYISKFCEPFVGFAYRSYAEQEGLFYGKSCPTNPGCGVAPPGKSTHQSGIAVDLFCIELSGSNIVRMFEAPTASITNSRSFDFIHPVSWDTPHFVGL